AFAVHDERLQAEGLARAAIELSIYRVAASTPAPLSRGNFVFRIGNAGIKAEFSAETARIDLNAAPKDLLAGLFATLAPRAPRPNIMPTASPAGAVRLRRKIPRPSRVSIAPRAFPMVRAARRFR